MKKLVNQAKVLKLQLDAGNINIHVLRNFLTEVQLLEQNPKPIKNRSALFLKHLSQFDLKHKKRTL